MSKEIVDAIEAIAEEKGIPLETLMVALEDALLSAYRKDPESAEYARVRIDRDSGDFVVYELSIPEDLLPLVLTEPDEEELTAIDPETGEARQQDDGWSWADPLTCPSATYLHDPWACNFISLSGCSDRWVGG